MNCKLDKKTQRRLAKLDALEAGGVDNWEWYDESLTEWFKEGELDDAIEYCADQIQDLLIDADIDYPGGRDMPPNVNIDRDLLENVISNFVEQIRKIK